MDDFNEMFGTEDDLIETIQEPNEDIFNEPNAEASEGNFEKESSDQETKRIVKPKKVVARPQPKLDAARLTGPRGIGILEDVFKNVKLKGKGHEKDDLDKVMKTLEHWAHRLFPKMSFDDCIDRIEDIGSKRGVLVHVSRIRLGMDDTVSETFPDDPVPVVHDPFDNLLNDKPKEPTLTEEQKARMMRNRLLAEERRMERMKAAMEKKNLSQSSTTEIISSPME
ncbi:unnamed protein product [Nezara viridula]|uniref:TIMELESS-interacting protein n=1 Tax=Nezara viridula TaxID=85310 RepID=A0A9P0MUP2_NEZVI|nr:unnamed protein product [Nezara viridula]